MGKTPLAPLAAVTLVLGLGALPLAGCVDRAVEVSLDKAVKSHDTRVGTGPPAEPGNLVEIHYTAALPDGSIVIDTRPKGKTHKFVVGDGSVVPGVDEGIVGMRTGGVRVLVLPPHAHYGRAGYAGIIPPETVLRFEIEMVRVNRSAASHFTMTSPTDP